MSALRELLATFGFAVDTSALSAADGALGDVSSSLANIGKGVLAAFAVDAVFSFGRETLQIADNLAKQATRLGISTEALQGWQHAAALSGSSAEEFTAAFTKFTRNVDQASESAGGPAAKAFKELGVTVKDAAGEMGKPIDLLDGVVAGLEGIEDPAKRTALVMDLFGKSGAKLLPLFSEGPEGLKELRGEVDALGMSFDAAFLENAQEVNDNVDRVKTGLRGLMVQVIGPLLPHIVKLTQGAVAVAKSFVGWIKQTEVARGLVTALGMKAVPHLITGMKMLGRIALRTVAPFLLLEDAVGWLAGDDSVIGEALDKLFGAGTGEEARQELLQWFTDVKNVVVNDLAPAITSITESPLFKGAAKGALEGILTVLRAIGLALTDNEERAARLAEAIQDSLAKIGIAPDRKALEASHQKQLDAYEKGEPTDDMSPFMKTVQKGMFAVFGNPYDDPNSVQSKTLAANKARADAAIEAKRAAAAPPAPVGPPVPVDYTAAFRAPVATTPSPVASYDYSQTTVAPVTNVTVKVEGGGSDEAVGNRIGKAAAKTIAGINTRAIKDSLVPTPGG